MHSKSGRNQFVIPGILAGIVLGACTYDAPTTGNPSGAGGTNQVASSSSGSGTNGASSGQGGIGGQTNSSSSGDIVSSSSSSSSGEAGSSSSGMVTSSSSSASSSGFGDVGVNCDGTLCKQAGSGCCDIGSMFVCVDLMSCQGASNFLCDGREDCMGALCCFDGKIASCKPDCMGGKVICNDNTDCLNGGSCDTTAHGTIGECN